MLDEKIIYIEIYTNRVQCEKFGVSYYDASAELVISAGVLLSSNDYDAKHKEFLEYFGSAELVLTRTPYQCPGWWKVTNVIT